MWAQLYPRALAWIRGWEMHGSGDGNVMPIPGDPELPAWVGAEAAPGCRSRPHSTAAECSEASHCEKNEQIIGFSISSKGARARPRHCVEPWEEPLGRSHTSQPAPQPQGCSQLHSSRLRANGDWESGFWEGTMLENTTGIITVIPSKARQEEVKCW